MRYIDNRHVLLAQHAYLPEQGVDLMLRERGRGLVHHHHARVVEDHLGDLGHLLLRGGQVAGHVGGADGHLHRIQHALGLVVHPLFVNKYAVFLLGLHAQKNVFRDGQVVGDAQLLMDDRDARVQRLFWAYKTNGLAVQNDFALGRRIHAGEDFDQRGLARAVLPQQGVQPRRGKNRWKRR